MLKKKGIDHLTLYSFDASFQLFRADVENLEFYVKMPPPPNKF